MPLKAPCLRERGRAPAVPAICRALERDGQGAPLPGPSAVNRDSPHGRGNTWLHASPPGLPIDRRDRSPQNRSSRGRLAGQPDAVALLLKMPGSGAAAKAQGPCTRSLQPRVGALLNTAVDARLLGACPRTLCVCRKRIPRQGRRGMKVNGGCLRHDSQSGGTLGSGCQARLSPNLPCIEPRAV